MIIEYLLFPRPWTGSRDHRGDHSNHGETDQHSFSDWFGNPLWISPDKMQKAPEKPVKLCSQEERKSDFVTHADFWIRPAWFLMWMPFQP